MFSYCGHANLKIQNQLKALNNLSCLITPSIFNIQILLHLISFLYFLLFPDKSVVLVEGTEAEISGAEAILLNRQIRNWNVYQAPSDPMIPR